VQSSRRSCSRGVRFRGFVWDAIKGLAEGCGLDVNALVNKACEVFLLERLTGEVKERFLLEAEVSHLIEEEKNLRQDLALILRSGAYLKDYASSLLEGDKAEVSRLKRRRGVYACVDAKELDVILRILARREAISKRLVELMDKTLPKDRYPFGLTEKGFRAKPKGGEKT